MARGKGEGSVYMDSQGRWTAVIALPPDPVTGRRRRKYIRARTRAEVVRRMRQVQVEVARAGDVPTGRALTVTDWLERWLERDVAPVRKPSTTSDYRSAARVHIVPAIGRRRLDRLTPDDIRAVHRAVLGRGASTTTAAKIHRVLRTALGAAEREDLVPRNVARLVRSPPTSSAPPRSMTTAGAGRFLEARRRRGDYARWATSLLLGARQGEVLGITLDDLHLDTGAPSMELVWEVRRVRWTHGCAATRPQDGAVTTPPGARRSPRSGCRRCACTRCATPPPRYLLEAGAAPTRHPGDPRPDSGHHRPLPAPLPVAPGGGTDAVPPAPWPSPPLLLTMQAGVPSRTAGA